MKERNWLTTENITRNVLKAGYGLYDATQRLREVHKTMRRIKYVLTERYYAWEKARSLARTDPDILIDEDNSLISFEPSQETLAAREHQADDQDDPNHATSGEKELSEKPIKFIPRLPRPRGNTSQKGVSWGLPPTTPNQPGLEL